MKNLEETQRFDINDINIDKSSDEEKKLEQPESELIEIEEINNINNDELKDDNHDVSKSDLADIVKNDFQEKTIVEMNIPKCDKIGIASDHRGYKLKQKLTKYLTKKGYTVVDFGTDSTISSDYPEFGFKLGQAVSNFEVPKGIAICGSGIGISIACNKIKGVRCAKVDNTKEVKYTRRDNDANIIAIAGNMPLFRAKDIVDVFLKTKFTGLERHQKRIDMLNNKG